MKTILTSVFAVLVLFTLSAPQLAAQSKTSDDVATSELCGMSFFRPENLVGEYSFATSTGIMNLGTVSTGFPASQEMTATMSTIGGNIVFKGSTIDVAFSADETDATEWNFDTDGKTPTLADIALSLGCAVGDLTRYSGSGSYAAQGTTTSADNVAMDTKLYLVLLAVDEEMNVTRLQGHLIWNAQGIEFNLPIKLWRD